MRILIIFMMSFPLYADVKTDGFIIQIKDRSILVFSPEKTRKIFSVLIENQSLSNQIGKIMVGNKNLTFISVPSKKSEAVEIKNEGASSVMFVPLSPSSQEVPLQFGKKSYEIPSKE
jgi:hypothetical protein